MEGGNVLAWVPRGRITVRGRHSLNDQGMVAVLEGVCLAPAATLCSSIGSASVVLGQPHQQHLGMY